MSSSTIYHVHHMIPRHMGGTDNPDNLIKLTIEQHAEAHRQLYERYGYEQDNIAYRMLSGQIDKAQAIKELQKAPKSIRWKKQKSEQMKGKGNPMYGKTFTHTDEAKEKISKRFKGVPKNYKVVNPVMKGKDNPRSRQIIAEGIVYNTIKECCDAYGFKNHNTIRYRLNSPKWTEWNYID